MDIAVNYWWIGALALGVIILLVWVARRDQKDEKAFENEIIQSEIPKAKHNDHSDADVTP
jgi:hypothetical protein